MRNHARDKRHSVAFISFILSDRMSLVPYQPNINLSFIFKFSRNKIKKRYLNLITIKNLINNPTYRVQEIKKPSS